MAGNRQLEDLRVLYAERSEPELLALYEQRDDLTEVAQAALAQVMRERKLFAPGVAAQQAALAEPDAEESRAVEANEVCLFTFGDAFQASEALRLLEKNEIACRMVNWDQLQPRREGGGPPMRLGLVVKKSDAEQARLCLQEEMNLFSPAEGHDEFDELDGLMLVGVFAREDALRVAHALGSDGVSYVWGDDREDPRADTDDVQIEVHGGQLEHAQQLAERALAAAG